MKLATSIVCIVLALLSAPAWSQASDPVVSSSGGFSKGTLDRSVLDSLFERKLRQVARDVVSEKLDSLLTNESLMLEVLLGDAVAAVIGNEGNKLAQKLVGVVTQMALVQALQNSGAKIDEAMLKRILTESAVEAIRGRTRFWQGDVFDRAEGNLIFTSKATIAPAELKQKAELDVALLAVIYHIEGSVKVLDNVAAVLEKFAALRSVSIKHNGSTKVFEISPQQQVFAAHLKTAVERLRGDLRWLRDNVSLSYRQLLRRMAEYHGLGDEQNGTSGAQALAQRVEHEFGAYDTGSSLNLAEKLHAALARLSETGTYYREAAIAALSQVVAREPRELLAALDGLGERSGAEVLQLALNYVAEEKPFSRYCKLETQGPHKGQQIRTDNGEVSQVPDPQRQCQRGTAALLVALEALPAHLVVGSETDSFELNIGTYTRAVLPDIESAFTFSNWSMYLAVQGSFTRFERTGGCDNANPSLACADEVVDFYHEKLGAKYRWKRLSRASSPLSSNIYASGVLFKNAPRGEQDFNGDLKERSFLGVDFLSLYYRELFEINFGAQYFFRDGLGGEFEKPVYVIGLAIPLSEYFAELLVE